MTSNELMAFQGSPNAPAPATKPTQKIALESLPAPVRSWLAPISSPHTRDAYHLAISLWLRWCIVAGVHPEAPTLEDAEAWVAWLQTEEHGSRGIGKRSANARASAVSSLYNRLLAQNKISYNPFAGLVSVKIKTSRMKTPAVENSDVKKMLQAGGREEHKANLAVLELLFTTGARAFEIGEANIGSLASDAHGGKLVVTRKGGEEQELPVTVRAAHAIKAANAQRGDLPPTAPLLVGPRGKRYSRHTISRLVHRIAQEAGVHPDVAKLVTAHTTRRTVATELAEKNEDLRTIQTLLGHKDPRTTEGYIRAKKDREKHAAAASTLSGLFH